MEKCDRVSLLRMREINVDRFEFEKYILEKYSVGAEYPWIKYPTFAVFRHNANQKWFAVVMHIPKSKLGIKEDGSVDVVNLKCRSDMLEWLWNENGIFPAYHMNKMHWISVILDSTVTADTVTNLLEISFDLKNNKK